MSLFNEYSFGMSDKIIDSNFLKFAPNSTICFCGPSGCGKSTLVFNILKERNELFSSPPVKILYCYNIYQTLFDEMKDTLHNVSFLGGLPTIDEIHNFCDKNHNIVVIDDLSHKLVMNPDLEVAFTQLCHHWNLSIIFVLHNLYQQGKCSRTIALNTKYLLIFKSPRDNNQIIMLAKQAYPHKSQYVMESYCNATSDPFGYLLFDFTPHTPDELRLRSNILPHEIMSIYIPQK